MGFHVVHLFVKLVKPDLKSIQLDGGLLFIKTTLAVNINLCHLLSGLPYVYNVLYQTVKWKIKIQALLWEVINAELDSWERFSLVIFSLQTMFS